jgi:hypothetical protein
MYFSESQPERHEANYRLLSERYGAEDSLSAAACYIVAIPGIYESIPEGKTGSNPLTWYWGPFDQVLDRRGESALVAGLPSGLKELVRAGIELFAGRPLHFQLAQALQQWDEEEYQLFLQAVSLFRLN